MDEYPARVLDDVFFALSHRARRRLLDQLANAPELRVTELARRHRMSLNSVSKHVVVLERAGLVRRRVAGRDHFIRVAPDRLAAAEAWLQHHRQFWNAQLDNLAQFFARTKGETR
jgi:DNA-binding transcriptional ArsR family regulator